MKCAVLPIAVSEVLEMQSATFAARYSKVLLTFIIKAKIATPARLALSAVGPNQPAALDIHGPRNSCRKRWHHFPLGDSEIG